MAKKNEVAIFTPNELSAPIAEKAMNAYLWAYRHAGIEIVDEESEADFVSERNMISGWKDLDDLRVFFEKAAKSIKSIQKHVWNVGSVADLPDTKELSVSWDKQTYTYEWQDDLGQVAVVNDLIQKGIVSVEQIVTTLGVNQIAKAAGMEQAKLMELYPQYICAKNSERKLRIKGI